MNAAHGTTSQVLKCAPKIVACYNAQTYSGCAVGTKHFIYEASPSEALKSLLASTNQLLIQTSLLNQSLQPSTHSSLAVPNKQINKYKRNWKNQQEHSITHHALRSTSVTEYMLTVTVVFSKLISINLFSDYSADDSSMSMHVTTVNCRSVMNKRANLETSTNYIKSGVICGCISWLNNNIKSSEVVRDYYTAYRKDRNTAGGGLVLIEAHILRWTKPQRRLWNCEGQNTTPKQK